MIRTDSRGSPSLFCGRGESGRGPVSEERGNEWTDGKCAEAMGSLPSQQSMKLVSVYCRRRDKREAIPLSAARPNRKLIARVGGVKSRQLKKMTIVTCQTALCYFVQTTQFTHSSGGDSLTKRDDFSNFFAKTDLMLDDYQEYWLMRSLRLGGSWQVWENEGVSHFICLLSSPLVKR